MLEGVTGQEGVADLDIALHILFQAVFLQEAENGGDVVVILVLGRFLRLGLDQDLALEADLFSVIDDEVEEAGHLVLFLANLGIEQGFVTFTAAQST